MLTFFNILFYTTKRCQFKGKINDDVHEPRIDWVS